MKREELWRLINEAITDEVYYQYLTAPYGERLGIYLNDGEVKAYVGRDVGREIAEEELPIAAVKVIGFGDLDMSDYAEGFAIYDRETGLYVTDDGRELTDAELLWVTITEGDITEEREALIERLIEDYEEMMVFN